jgi:hypothetical protein
MGHGIGKRFIIKEEVEMLLQINLKQQEVVYYYN